jgi:hypothetical protein
VIEKVFRSPRQAAPVELAQFSNILTGLWTWYEDAYLHQMSGLFDADTFEPVLNSMRGQLALPVFRAYWTSFGRAGRSTRFVRFVDDLLPTIAVRQPPDPLLIWNMALDEAEKAIPQA